MVPAHRATQLGTPRGQGFAAMGGTARPLPPLCPQSYFNTKPVDTWDPQIEFIFFFFKLKL